MEDRISGAIEQHFGDLENPLIDRTKPHKLGDILAIAICAVIAGTDNWEDIEEFGNVRLEWFKTFIKLPNSFPSHDTFNLTAIEIRGCRRFSKSFRPYSMPNIGIA